MRLCRLQLRRNDKRVHLDRWGVEGRLGGIYLHHIAAPDPGLPTHDHPWWFASIIVRGGYREIIRERSGHRHARDRRRWSLKSIRLDQSHQIYLVRGDTWTVVFRGPRVRPWGFWVGSAYVAETDYINRGLKTSKGQAHVDRP